MRENKKKSIFIVLILFILLAWQGNLFSIFQPKQEGLHQLVSTNQFVFDGDATTHYLTDLISGISSGSTTNGNVLHNTGSTTNPWNFATFTNPNIVTINTGKNIFRFEAEMSGNGLELGIPNPSPPISSLGLPYCWQKINVFKDGNLVNTFKSWKEDSNAWNTKTFFSGHVYTVLDDNNNKIEIRMSDKGDGNQVGKFFAKCRIFDNTYKLIFNESVLNINISIPDKNIIEGKNVTVKVNIENKLNIPVFSKVTTTFKVNTILGDILKSDFKLIELNPGDNILTFNLKATDVETEILVKVKADILYKGGNLEGLNEYRKGYNTARCFNTRGDGGCNEWALYKDSNLLTKLSADEKIEIGTISSDEEVFSIIPKPLYLEISSSGGCPNGYVPNKDSSLCIRDDVSELTCFVLGCPSLNGTQYECTSAGICAETVFISQSCKYDQETFNLLNESVRNTLNENQICPIGTTCDVDTGFCIKSELIHDLIQCDNDNDCATPCDGKTASCNELNRCSYSGECTPQTIGCNDVGCSEGFTCNQQLNVCESSGDKFIISDNIVKIMGISLLTLFGFVLYRRFRRKR